MSEFGKFTALEEAFTGSSMDKLVTLADQLRLLQGTQQVAITTPREVTGVEGSQSIFARICARDITLPPGNTIELLSYRREQNTEGRTIGEAGVKIVNREDPQWPAVLVPVYTYEDGHRNQFAMPVEGFFFEDMTAIMNLVTQMETIADIEGVGLNGDCTGFVIPEEIGMAETQPPL